MALTTVEKALQDFVCAASGLDDQHVIFDDGRPRPEGTYIALNIETEEAPADDDDAREHNPLVLATKTITARSGDALTIVAHPYASVDGPFTYHATVTPMAGLVEGGQYWIIVDGVDTIRLATSRANARTSTAIALSSDGAGVHTLASNANTRRMGAEIKLIKQGPRLCQVQMQCFSTAAVGAGTARAVLTKMVNRSELSNALAILDAGGVGTVSFDTVQSIPEITNRNVFQSRAVTVLTYFIVAREYETNTTIEAAQITNPRGRTYTVRKP